MGHAAGDVFLKVVPLLTDDSEIISAAAAEALQKINPLAACKLKLGK